MFLSELNIEIRTGYQKGFQWSVNENIWFIGYFYNQHSEYITDLYAIDHISKKIGSHDFREYLLNLNGVFSIIIKIEEEIILYSDKSRFFPLFYSKLNNKLIITDDFYFLIGQQAGKIFNKGAVIQFLAGAFVSGAETIISNINQVRPAELVSISEKSIQKYYTSTFSVRIENLLSYKESALVELAYVKFQKAGKCLADSLKNKQILLPLSGGYDSRLIACWLKENNIENVICFTFGRKDSPEISISQNVAKKLNFDWHYVEYKAEMVDDYINNPEFLEYYKYASRGTSMFYMQEYFALLELKNKGILGNNFVAIPGHSGDFLGGSQIYKVVPAKNKIQNPEKLLFNKSFWQQTITPTDKKRIINLIKEQLNEIKLTFNSNAGYSIMEDWLIKERIIKYVFNSSHIFTFFGGEVRFPFWDNELYEFWKSVPLEYRLHKKLYNKILEEKYFNPLNVEFGSHLQPSEKDIFFQKVKSNIKPKLPFSLRNKYRKRNDWVLYDEITQPMLKELTNSGFKIKDNGLSYLYRILNWYIFKIKIEYNISNKHKGRP